MSIVSSKNITIAIGVVIGSALFKKFLEAPLTNALPSKGM